MMSIFRNKEKISRKNEEEVNAVKAAIYLKKDTKIVGITSCLFHEGRTLLAKRLAESVARDNKKALFLNLDIRNSKGNENGIANVVMKEVELHECISSVGNLDILSVGNSESVTGLFANYEFIDIMEQLKNNYDYIIVDTPQLSEFIDTVQIAEVCDGMIMALEPYVVPYKMAVDCKRKLERSSTPILGVVMNKVD